MDSSDVHSESYLIDARKIFGQRIERVHTDDVLHDRWRLIAQWRAYGETMAVFRDCSGDVCVHSFSDETGWPAGVEPLFGYFSKELTWDELLDQLVERYVAMMRARTA